MDGALDVIEVFNVDLNKSGDLLPLLPVGAARCTLVEDVSKDVLLIPARTLSALLRFVAAGLFIKVHDVEIRLSIDRLPALKLQTCIAW